MRKPPLILVGPSLERKGHEFGDTSLSLSNNYTQAILAAGGLPLTAGCTTDENDLAEMVRRSDGVLLTGGDDIQPELYRSSLPQRLRKTVEPAIPERDLMDLLLVDQVFAQRKPLFAICRGHQVLNVALGGTLLIDISSERPAAINHRRTDKKCSLVHKIKMTRGSLLAKVAGTDTMSVNSTHHQAVERMAEVLAPCAVSPDGIIEGMELNDSARKLLPYLVAVQFHPERLFARHPVFLELFRSFIRACRLN